MTVAEVITAELITVLVDGSEEGKIKAIKELSRADPHLAKPDLILVPSGVTEESRASNDAMLTDLLGRFLKRTAVTTEVIEETPKALPAE